MRSLFSTQFFFIKILALISVPWGNEFALDLSFRSRENHWLSPLNRCNAECFVLPKLRMFLVNNG